MIVKLSNLMMQCDIKFILVVEIFNNDLFYFYTKGGI